jgi:hypothetical protein
MATCSSSPPTYEKILNRHGLKRQEMKRRCSGDELFPIAREMTRWRSINLGLQKGVINSIENDPTTGEEEKQIKLLERWSESYGHDATYDRLAYSFCSSNRVDLADVVCEMRKKGYQVPLPASDSLSEETETEGNVQPFVTAEEATTTVEQQLHPPSYDEIVRYCCGNKSELMKAVCPQVVIENVGKELTEWKRNHLGLDYKEIDDIKNDRSIDDDRVRSMKYVRRWKEVLGHTGTYERMARAFVKALRTDLAEFVCSECLSAEDDSEFISHITH